ncbi:MULTISPECIES: hypothetical protein [Ferrimicrobium]|uniref:PBP domain-containing protein n=1 Tax=Ferrimicrobium acidiphilum TaxID=121039 RepID=A0ABV3XYV7_9ACTN|nr:hypothetical protein [Ferrimicrobium sp.]
MPTHNRGRVLGALVPIVAVALAACGTTTAKVSSTPVTPNKTTTALRPVSLNGVTLTALVATPLETTFSGALVNLAHLYPHLKVAVTASTATSMDLASLEHSADLRLFSVNPGRTLIAQIGGVESVPIGTSTLYVSADLATSRPITLTSAILIGIIEGSITNWNNSLIATANPRVILPNLAITMNPLSHSGQRAAIITHKLAVLPANFGAAYSNHCATTPGCIDFSLNAPSLPLPIDSLGGHPNLPSSNLYPLVTSQLAVITIDSAHPRREAAAVRLAELLVEDSNLPASTRTSELTNLRALQDRLALTYYASDPAAT